jgi:aromatic-L-amino-acid/L-tryptophan decarboxylase
MVAPPSSRRRHAGSARRSAPVDLPPARFRRLGYRAIDLLADYYASLPRRRIVPSRSPEAIERVFRGPLPRTATSADRVLERWRTEIVPNSAHLGSPRFFGYVHGSGLQIAALADLLAAGQDPNVADWRISPAETEVERRVVRWMAEMIGYPQSAGGMLMSGGMAANHSALFVALRARSPYNLAEDGLQDPRRKGRFTLYLSAEEGHVTIGRSADLLNLGRGAVRPVRCGPDLRMDVASLERQIRADRAAGDTPFCVVGQAGSINVGAIDPLDAIADVCRRQGLWFHVDGAAGGFGPLLPELRPKFRGLARADSVTVDPHKWMYLPKECGGLLVRDPRHLARAFQFEASYLQSQTERGTDLRSFRAIGPQSSRGFRALKVWMALQQLGTDGYVRLFRRNLACVARLDRLVRADPDFEALHAPQLYIYSFRYVPRDLPRRREGAPPRRTPGGSTYVDRLNTAIADAMVRSGRFFLTTTSVRGVIALRVSVCNHRTALADIEALYDALRATGRRLDRTMRSSRPAPRGKA